MTNTTLRSRLVPLGAVASLSLVLAACGGQSTSSTSGGDSTGGGLSGEVRVDGSSTVAPLSSAAGELFKEKEAGVNVSVGTSGTGGGFKKFCAGETDISDASRPIKDEEKADCDAKGIEFAEIIVANDALTVVVNNENTWAKCLTVDQLKKMWEPAAEKTVTTWQQVDASFPAEKLELYGPGTDSGTFDYFTAEVNGEEGASRTDFNPSEDDNVIVQGVEGSKGALGYFGFSYFEENAKQLTALEIDGGAGCVAPSSQAAQDGTYTPLARPLFIYVAKKSFAEKPHVKAFVEFYVDNDKAITEQALFVPLNDEQLTKATSALTALGG